MQGCFCEHFLDKVVKPRKQNNFGKRTTIRSSFFVPEIILNYSATQINHTWINLNQNYEKDEKTVDLFDENSFSVERLLNLSDKYKYFFIKRTEYVKSKQGKWLLFCYPKQ